MPRKVLGNDPFSRGAAERLGPTTSAAPPSAGAKLPPLIAAAATEPAPIRLAPRPQRPRTPEVPRKRAVPDLEDGASIAVPELGPMMGPTTGGTLPAKALLETTASRLRELFGHRLPALLNGLARSSIDALGLTAMPIAVSDVDAFGMSLEFVNRWQPVLARILRSYFRTEVLGLDKLPTEGPAILVCNHSGILPYDELLLSVAVRDTPSGGRDLRALSEDFAINAPFAGSWLNRFGFVRASQDNAERLLRSGAMVAVFPEGSQGIAKPFRNRYRLQRFGRGGFVRLALRTQVPIFPVALVGGEESQPVMARVKMPRPVRLSHLPLTPTFPWLGPLGLVPLPTRWTVQIGDRIPFEQGPAAAEDRALVSQLTEDVRQTLQRMLDATVANRTSVFL